MPSASLFPIDYIKSNETQVSPLKLFKHWLSNNSTIDNTVYIHVTSGRTTEYQFSSLYGLDCMKAPKEAGVLLLFAAVTPRLLVRVRSGSQRLESNTAVWDGQKEKMKGGKGKRWKGFLKWSLTFSCDKLAYCKMKEMLTLSKYKAGTTVDSGFQLELASSDSLYFKMHWFYRPRCLQLQEYILH